MIKILNNQEVITLAYKVREMKETRNIAFEMNDWEVYHFLNLQIKNFQPICWN